MPTVVAVVGTIAGAGTTTAVTALGTALGEQRRRVALVDATDEGSRLADAIDVGDAGNLTNALRRGATVGDVQVAGPHDVAAFPAGPGTNWGAVRPDAVAELYDRLRDRFEFALVDAGNALSPAAAAWLGHADEVVIVTDPDVAGSVPETVALARAFDVPVRGVLANRVPYKEVSDALDALEATGETVLGVLPEDPTVGEAADAGTTILRTDPDSPIATAAWELARRVGEDDHEEPILPTGSRPTSGNRSAGAGDGAAQTDDAHERAGGSDGGTDSSDEQTGDGRDEDAGQPAASETAPGDDETGGSDSNDGESDGSDPNGDESDGRDASDEVVPGDRDASGGEATPSVETTESKSTGGTTDVSSEEPSPAPASDGPEARAGASVGSDLAGEVRARDREEPPGADEPDDDEDRPLGNLLGDVRDRVGRAEEETERAGRSRTQASDDRGKPGDDAGAPGAGASDGAATDDDSSFGADAGRGDDGAELSDDEIEAVFKQTMERVRKRREEEESADGDA